MKPLLSTDLSSQLLRLERDKAERRLALVRVVVLGLVTVVQLLFTLVSPPSDYVVQVRAVWIFGTGTVFSAGWWWVIRRIGVFRGAALVSTTHDCLVAAAILLNWSIYPGGVVLPTQLQFGVGFGILIGVLVLTAVRFDYRTVLVATAECVVFYLGLAALVATMGTVQFVSAVSESNLPDTVNAIDFGGRIAILIIVGGMLAYLNHRVDALLQRSVRTTEQKQRLGQFISTNVVEAIESGEARLDLSGQSRRIAILFCDIRGFTKMSEALEPEELLKVLNGYYELAAEEIFRHRGTLDKYLGDGFMALFGAPEPLSNPSQAALECGLALLEKVRGFKSHGGQALTIGVGIHTDEVVVGNLGTEAYKSYTAIGRGVNVAARIESATATTDAKILFSRAVKEELGPHRTVKEVGSFELKGIADPLVLFTASTE